MKEPVSICDDCGKPITTAPWVTVVVGRVPVYGRIGAPSNEITGFTRGTRLYRCAGCLRELGPLT